MPAAGFRGFARLIAFPLVLAMLVQCSPILPRENTTVAQSAPAPKPPDEDGIGGTGAAPPTPKPTGDEQGIGGTGVTAKGSKPLNDQGIGGTGIGGTGIIGMVTGFGSVIVNGHHIEFDSSTPVSDPVGPVDATALRVGHVVAISAATRNGALIAREILKRHPAAGPIDAVDISRGRIRVLGQWISVVHTTKTGLVLDRLAVGDSVTVSGFRRADGIVVATRIDKRDPAAPGIVTARVTQTDGQQVVAVMVGPIRNGRMVAAQSRVRPRVPFAGRLRQLSIQGFPARPDARGFQLRNLAVVGAETAVAGNALVVVDGTTVAGELQAQNIAVGAPGKPRRDLIEKGLSEPWHLRTLPDGIEGLIERNGGANPLPDGSRQGPPPVIVPPRLPSAPPRR